MNFMVFILSLSFVILNPFKASAGVASQTDWSGGGGIHGPVIEWDDEFYSDTGVECYIIPSDIVLKKSMLPNTIDGTFEWAQSVFSADINGDDLIDVLGASFTADEIAWWENSGSAPGVIWTKHTVDLDFRGAYSVYSADVNGDGHMDVLAAASIEDKISWWENVNGSGTNWTEHTVDMAFTWASSVYSADLNGDDYMDILGASQGDDEIVWWENVDGSGTLLIEHTIADNIDGARSAKTADVNGDGYMDVLGAVRYDNDITWWENLDGSGVNWTEHTVDEDFGGAYSVCSADLNGDGYMDVIGAAHFDDMIVWWENADGSGVNWTEHIVEVNFNNAEHVHSVDVNGDGYMDILGAASLANEIIWWENLDGLGTSWMKHTSESIFVGANSVYSADVNGDDHLDILGANYYGVSWWDPTKYFPNGWLISSILDVQDNPAWQTINWNCIEPAETSVAFQVRASDSLSNMGDWSDTLSTPCSLSEILTEGDQYFQYRVILNTSDSLLSPVLHDVTISWNSVGIEGGSIDESFKLHGARPNPAQGYAVLIFTVPMDSRAVLLVYDLTGRIVYSVDNEYRAGVHEVILDELTSGLYMVRMIADEFTDTQHFVFID